MSPGDDPTTTQPAMATTPPLTARRSPSRGRAPKGWAGRSSELRRAQVHAANRPPSLARTPAAPTLPPPPEFTTTAPPCQTDTPVGADTVAIALAPDLKEAYADLRHCHWALVCSRDGYLLGIEGVDAINDARHARQLAEFTSSMFALSTLMRSADEGRIPRPDPASEAAAEAAGDADVIESLQLAGRNTRTAIAVIDYPAVGGLLLALCADDVNFGVLHVAARGASQSIARKLSELDIDLA